MKYLFIITLLFSCCSKKSDNLPLDYYSLIADKRWSYKMQIRGTDTIRNNLDIWFSIRTNYWYDSNDNFFQAKVVNNKIMVDQLGAIVIYEISYIKNDSLILKDNYKTLHYKRTL